MTLTNEQEHIINLSKKLKSNEILSIEACAGSGKTFTLEQIALNNTQKKFLYLAFNRAIVEESSAKFPKNVSLKTLHSLALSYTKKKLGNFEFIDNLNIFHLSTLYKNPNQELILILKEFNNFLKSSESLEKQSKFIKELFNAVLEKKLPVFHSFYLKFYALAKDKGLEKEYDFILLDEAQDSNAVMLSIFLNNNCAKILVGDSFQNIYGFNNSINAFKIIEPNYKTSLSHSFRCNQSVVDYANFFLKSFSNDFTKIKSNSKTSQENLQEKAFITRTNAGIIEFIDEIKNEKDYKLLKEPSKIFNPVFALINYKKYNFDLLPKEFAYFKNFSNFKELLNYIEQTGDKELLSALNLLHKNLNLSSLFKKATRLFKNKNAKNFIINAHQAKGLEWDSVELYNDFTPLDDLLDKLKTEKNHQKKVKLYSSLEQERNLFYVAITRAKEELIDRSKNQIFWLKNNTTSQENTPQIQNLNSKNLRKRDRNRIHQPHKRKNSRF